MKNLINQLLTYLKQGSALAGKFIMQTNPNHDEIYSNPKRSPIVSKYLEFRMPPETEQELNTLEYLKNEERETNATETGIGESNE